MPKRAKPKMQLVIEIPSAPKPYDRIVLDPDDELIVLSLLDQSVSLTVKDYLEQSRAWINIPADEV